MNRLEIQHEAMARNVTRYTLWLRMGAQFAHVSNYCTLSAALRAAQQMQPIGYITAVGERP